MDRELFISAMRRVANSVSIVTTNGSAGRHGATVSSFCSVSADPPMVLVCLHAKSRIAQYVEQNGKFNVNVLPEGASELARRFAGQNACCEEDRFKGIGLTAAAVPSFPMATVFECCVDSISQAGSHQIVIGAVQSAIIGENDPLTYLDGDFLKLVPLSAQKEAVNE